ncbi:hypothetical protein YC2023_118700 [Brassica napus]
MVSCDNSVRIDEHNRGDDDDSDSLTEDETQTQSPRTHTKGKHKEAEDGSGSKSKKKSKTTSWGWEHFIRKKDDLDRAYAATVAKICHVQPNLELLT